MSNSTLQMYKIAQNTIKIFIFYFLMIFCGILNICNVEFDDSQFMSQSRDNFCIVFWTITMPVVSFKFNKYNWRLRH
jgi:hypothetical protein